MSCRKYASGAAGEFCPELPQLLLLSLEPEPGPEQREDEPSTIGVCAR